MITSTGHTKIKKWIQSLIKEGQYTINGTVKKTPIFKTELSGDVITIYLYLDDTAAGKITKIQLIDQDGEVFDDQPDSIDKKAINSLLVAFKYTIKKL